MAQSATSRKAAALAIATALAAPIEGMRQVWYYDPPGIPTVCMGHTGSDVDKTKVYSIAECKALLNKDMSHAIEQVERCAPGLPPKALAAFGDAAFNLGPTVVCDTGKSTIARLLKAGDIRGACERLPDWSKARIAGVLVSLPGLLKRRILERDLCLEGLA
jgi:lysozyme